MEPSRSLILAYVLIVLGLFLLAAELFMPSGTFLVLSLTAIVIGVAMTFLYSDDPTPGIVTLICVFVAVPLLGGVILHYWPKTRIGRRFFLQGPNEDATIASMPVNLELEQLRGRFGRTVSPLRPAGVTDFEGRRVDTITEGMMVDEGQWVRCIDVRAGKVIVRQVEKPDLGDLENALFE
jgi:membrane-bound serine protease (ClpP class)